MAGIAVIAGGAEHGEETKQGPDAQNDDEADGDGVDEEVEGGVVAGEDKVAILVEGDEGAKVREGIVGRRDKATFAVRRTQPQNPAHPPPVAQLTPVFFSVANRSPEPVS